jgi:HEAT repeat protein
MKRLFVAAGAFAAVLGFVFLLFFTVSKYRMEGQSYFESLSDFLFMIRSYNAEAFGSSVPELSEARYQRVMVHARDTAHSEVQRRVVRNLVRWKEEVVPRLMREVDEWRSPARVLAAARALGELRVEAAAPQLELALELARSDRWLAVRLIDAFAEIGPAAAPGLIASFQGYRSRGEDPPYNFLDAIGRSGGGASFLIEEMGRARTDEEILALEWPLAFSRDPGAARVLAALLRHRTLDVRRRARDSMTQSMGEVAIEPVLDVLATETDDYVRSSIIQRILAGSSAASSERAVELLGALLDDPVVAWEANYALARIGTERAVEILHERSAGRPPDEVMDNLEYTGALALRILQGYARHEDSYVRRQVIDKLLSLRDSKALPLLLELTDDPEPHTRRFAREAVLEMDYVLLEESARHWFEARTGRAAGRLRPPTREGTDTLVATLRFFHWVFLGVSFLLGLLLLSGRLRAFEPYKLTLVLSLLLLLGVAGDFLFLSEPALYRFATASRLVLLLGLLFLRDDPLPGETRGRMERLAVRSLWVLVPVLVFFGVPLLSEALRHALRDFEFLKWVLLLALALLFLVFEQAVVPWDLFPRGGRAERVLTFLLSSAVLAVFAAAIWRHLEEPGVASDDNRFFLGCLLLLPLLGAWAFHLSEMSLFVETPADAIVKSNPPGRLRVVRDREGLIIRLRRKRGIRGYPRLVAGALLLVTTWWLADRGGAARAGAPALVLLAIATIVAVALVWVVASGLLGGLAIQIRGPAVRAATTFLGGAFGRNAWVRRPRLPVVLEGLSLEPREKSWLASAVRGSRAPSSPSLALSLDGEEGGRPRLRVRNDGRIAASIADLEASEGRPVRVDGRHVFLSRDEREALVAPGATLTLHPRLYAALLVAVLLGAAPLRGAIVAEEPSDYTRALEAGPPSLWNEAVSGLLGENDQLPLHAVSSVMRRFDDLEPRLRVRVVRALRRHPQHPRTLETLVPLVREGGGELRTAAVESLFSLRTPAAMDAFEDLILEESPHRMGALNALVASADSVSPEAFDERYLPAIAVLLHAEDAEIRRTATKATMRIDTPGLRDEWARVLSDPDPVIREAALWHLAERGDARPCPELVDRAKADVDSIERVGSLCAPSSLFLYVDGYRNAKDDAERAFYGTLIENGLRSDFLDDPAMVASLRELSRSDEPFVREKVAAFLDWGDARERARNRDEALREAVLPIVLVLSATVAALLGILLFIWSFRLWTLATRVRNRPLSRAASLSSGPVALEGEAQPAGSYLRHPVTGEPCLYYAGADVAHPEARFYLEDDSGRVLVDPRRAVFFSEDGVLVAGERVHVVGFAAGRSPVVVGKDEPGRPLYSRAVHGLISALLGFGRSTSVTKMLFSDPRHCFWIWDDLERRPMGERRDQLWLALGVLLGGAWMVVFAVSVMGLVDREMSEPIARLLETLYSASPSPPP